MTALGMLCVGVLALSAAAQCPGGGGSVPTLKTIAVDGSSSDWANVLSNPLQLTNDGQFSANCDITPLDRDCSPGKNVTGRDLARFAWTYDATNIYVYQARFGSSSNTQAFYFYMDSNSNQRMNTGEKVLQIRYSGQTRRTDAYLYNYTAVGGAGGDAMVNGSGFADGYTMPGSLSNETLLYSGVTGGWSDGTGFEGRVAWTSLGVPAGTAVYFHVSSCNNANPGQVPSSIDDNLGGPGGGMGAFAFYLVSLEPDRSATVAPGSPTVVDYLHTITNAGTIPDRYDITAASSAGFQVDLYDDGTNTWMGTDIQGDGVWDSVNAAYDNPTANGRPNTPALAPNGIFAIRVRLTAPSGTENALDSTVLTATSQASPLCISDTATDATAVGALTLQPTPQSKACVPGQAVAFGLTMSNYSLSDTFDLTPVSSAAYRVDLYTDPNGDGDPSDGVLVATDLNGNGIFSDAGDSIAGGYDTNADGKPDFGAMAYGAVQKLVVRLTLPAGAAIGSVSSVSLQALGASNGAVATASLAITARTRLTLSPNYTVATGTNKYSGENRSVFYAHTLINGWPAADSVSLTAVSDHAWVARLYTDPNGDGNPNDGELITAPVALAANGGSIYFVVEVVIPGSLALPLTDTTTVTATSGLSPSTSVTVSDQVRVSYLAVYTDAGHALAGTYFVRCDTVYALGSSLAPNSPTRYQVRYLNPSSVPVRTVTIPSDGNGESPDQYTFGPSDPQGVWTLELWDGAVRIDTLSIVVDPVGTPSTIQPVSLNRASYSVSGDTLTSGVTFNNTSTGGTYTGTSYRYLFLNQSATLYLTTGGAFTAYISGDFTRVTTPHIVGPGASATETTSVPAVSFDGPGVYSLVVDWIGPCANTIATTTVTFPVGTNLASTSDAAHTVPSEFFASTSTIYLGGSYYLPSTAYTVAYYDAAGNLVTTQAATSTAGGAIAASILASALGSEGGWHAVVYPAATAPLANYSPGFAGALSEDAFTLDFAAPVTPAVASPANGASTNDNTPTITGTAEPNSTVTVYIDGLAVGTVAADGAGNWTYTSALLADGTYAVTATATDAAGNTSAASAPSSFTVDTAIPAAPVVTGPANGSTTNDSTPAITGTAEPNSTVTVFIDGIAVGVVTADGTGNWTYTSALLADGTYSVAATASDAAGNASGASAPSSFTVYTLKLLRYGGVTTLTPQTPSNSAIFVAQYPTDPSLDTVRDLEVSDFASGAAFPDEVNDLGGGSPPLVFYQVAGKAGSTLRVTLSGGKIVITH